jgi:glucose/arabinose dehydrogenase
MRLGLLHLITLVLLTAAFASCGGNDDDETPDDPQQAADAPARSEPEDESGGQRRESRPAKSAGSGSSSARTTVAENLEVPWGIDFLPNGTALIAERMSGRILSLSPNGELREEMTIPGVAAEGEGGLLGLAVSPSYRQDGLVYTYLTSAEDNRIVRFELGSDPDPILTGIAKSAIHNGGRIAFGPDGKLYAGVGDAGSPRNAQDRSSLNGKILRLEPNGDAPADNPFDGSPVYSLGHRNVQGLAWDKDGRLWATEFGQDTFDEVNLIRRGGNYGWPDVEGMGGGSAFTDPEVTWDPSESSPSGAAIAGGRLYVGALAGQRLWRVPLRGNSAGMPEPLLAGEYGRVRTVVNAPDGSLWIATSNRDGRGSPAPSDDRIIRLAEAP